MKVLLVQPRSPDVRHQPVTPLGLLAIGSYLKSNGYTVEILDRNIRFESISKVLEAYKPDIVGVSAITGTMLTDAVKVSKAAKEKGIPTVWGGVHPSLLPEQTLKSGVVDFVIIGEGEITMMELIETLKAKGSVHNVAGIAFIENGRLIINESRLFVDLSKMPPTDWSMVDVEAYFQGLGNCKRLLRIYTSKGCPGKCTFCYNQAFHKQKWRGRALEQVVDEVQLLVERYNADGIGFIDELWSPDRERMHKICKLMIERNINVYWYFNARVDQYTREDLELLYKAGCRWILFGIESGSPRILKEIKKGITLERVREIFNLCNQIGISTIASFMFGFPGETAEDLKLTAKFARDIKATYYDFTRFMCYPGTELFNTVVEGKLFKAPESLEEWAEISSWDRIAVNFTSVSNRELSVYNDYFAWINIRRMMKPDQSRTLIGYLSKLLPGKHKGEYLKSLKVGISSIYEVLRILCNLTLHPLILRKYGLLKEVSK